jgi:choline dehydrogenase-like flavoprotein
MDIGDIAESRCREMLGTTRTAIALHNRSEQSPNRESRVLLGEEPDALGKRVTVLDWRLNEIDKRSLRRAHELLGMELGRAGLGRLRVDLDETVEWPASLRGGSHHMGTTRMHVDPRQGVVDPDCRVHGISNLYVGGSSVFPTVGYSNPTLTIVALALRLGDHLKRELGVNGSSGTI